MSKACFWFSNGCSIDCPKCDGKTRSHLFNCSCMPNLVMMMMKKGTWMCLIFLKVLKNILKDKLILLLWSRPVRVIRVSAGVQVFTRIKWTLVDSTIRWDESNWRAAKLTCSSKQVFFRCQVDKKWRGKTKLSWIWKPWTNICSLNQVLISNCLF